MSTIAITDSDVLTLFRRWIEARRASAAADDNGAGEEFAVIADDLERQIADTPAAGPAALSIKTYIAMHLDDDDWREDNAALSGCAAGDFQHHADAYIRRAILRDIVAFVPEIGPLAADFINGVAPSPSPYRLRTLAVATNDKPAAASGGARQCDDDPILPLIAQEARLRGLADALRDRQDEIYFALPKHAREMQGVFLHNVQTGELEPVVCTDEEVDSWARHFGDEWAAGARAELTHQRAQLEQAREAAGYNELSRQARSIEAEADVVFDRIVATKARTLAGVIAQLELYLLDPTDARERILAGLRDIQRRLEAGDLQSVTIEPEVIGFGEPRP